MGSMPDGSGLFPVWPLGIPPTRSGTVMQAFDAGDREVLGTATKGSAAIFLALGHQGYAIDLKDWRFGK